MTRMYVAKPLSPFDAERAEVWRKKQISAVAFGVELRGVPLMLRSDWERIGSRVDRYTLTGRPALDEFWATRFSVMTTRWIHDHPDLDEVAKAFDHYRTIMGAHFDFIGPKYRHLALEAF